MTIDVSCRPGLFVWCAGWLRDEHSDIRSSADHIFEDLGSKCLHDDSAQFGIVVVDRYKVAERRIRICL
jgi:hypothetical protein